MNALLIEDDKLWRTKLKIMLDEIDIALAGVATSVEEAIEFLKGNSVDIIIADILLNQDTVFSVFEFDKTFCCIPTVLITQSDKEVHYKQAKMLSTYMYIVKPIHKLTLKSAVSTIFKKNDTHQNSSKIEKTIKLKGKHNEKIELPISSIYYIEQQANYCHIFTKSKTFVQKKSLTNIILELDANFLQIHRSYCVNTIYIEKYTAGLQNVRIMGVDLPIGRVLKNKVKEYLSNKFINQESY